MAITVNDFSIDRLSRLVRSQKDQEILWGEAKTYTELALQKNLKLIHSILEAEVLGRLDDVTVALRGQL